MRPSVAFEKQAGLKEFNKVEQAVETEFILSFYINSSWFGIAFDSIQEVVDYYPVSEYPFDVEGHFGIINLRGNIVPIIDPFQQNLEDLDLSSSKYVILQTSNGNMVGIIVNNVKKIEIQKELTNNLIDEKVVAYNHRTLRLINCKCLTKKYGERTNISE